MQLRLLGPFELRVDGFPLALPGRGERALLALLALSVGEVVATTTLIDALWSENELPSDPVNALQLRVSKLRRALRAAGNHDDLIRHEGAGYRVVVAAEDIDVHRFSMLVSTARKTGDPHAAVDLYDESLALWRSDPFVDFAGEPWTGVETVRLTELRLAAIAERAERMLTLGRYEQLVADLEPIVTGAPTRERLAGQLMTALFNAGRQAEALDIYARTRDLLAEELGLDPSRELRTLMEQILRQDAAITSERAAGMSRQRSDGPEEQRSRGDLPMRATSFVGREQDLKRVDDLLGRTRLLTLAGPGGAGKTALAIEAARAAEAHFQDGAWLVRLAAVTEPAMVAHAVADAVGVSIEGVRRLTARATCSSAIWRPATFCWCSTTASI